MPDISINIGNLKFKNPIMPASGTFGYGEEFAEFFDLNVLGAVVTKGISLKPKDGNPPPRIYEGDRYIMNSIGLENVGFENFIKYKLPFLEKFNCIKVVNFFGNSEDEYLEMAEKLNKVEGIDAIEVNLSCPNVQKGGLEFGLNEKLLFNITKDIVKYADKKVVMVKISPLVTDINSIGKALEEAGADAITAVNTIKGLGIDIENMKFSLGNVFGGVSGPLLKPVALRVIRELRNTVQIPIIGAGGIFLLKDALEFFVCGATAVQIGTANFSNPLTMPEIIKDMEMYMEENNLESMGDFEKCLNY